MGEVPDKVKGWNWGAFVFNIVWGIGNRTYLPLLCLIPGFNIIWIFICGFKGNEWAWKSGEFLNEDADLFDNIQQTWNRAGIVTLVASMILAILSFFILILLFQ